ncbi:ANL family adenylate-forming protein [Sciscionella marina]|uniref:ANL family adenylate-forming protein n=1 Tax=Sciscionella marina TaxID=508770 RepID=UPI00039D4A3C|nr:fatty acid--CoA ligase family protein [Sciscionella marina]
MPSTSVFLNAALSALDDGGDRVLFHHDGPVTYHEARDVLLRLHNGVGAVETVAVDLANRPETVLVQLAAMLRGARVLLVAASATDADRFAAAAAAGVTTVVTDRAEAWSGGGVRDVRSPADLEGTAAPVAVPAAVEVLFPTGGTTGTPKVIRHSGVYDGMAHIFATRPEQPERTLVVAPLTHMTGHASVLGALLRGDTVVLHDGFEAGTVLAAIERHRITSLSLTPPRLAALLDHPARPGTRLDSLRSVSLGAAPLPPHRLAQALEVFGPIVGQGYGLTEAPMITSISAAEVLERPERLGSVGRVVPGMAARITGGEVEVRGLAMMDGYLGAAPIGENWLRTGDLGRFDEEGYLYLHDRIDDIVVLGEHGTKVAPATVEHALASHPEVRAAAVFGVAGREGQSLHAVVVAEGPLGAEDIRAHVRASLGREHYVPARVDFAATLPITGIGKIDKCALRAAYGG